MRPIPAALTERLEVLSAEAVELETLREAAERNTPVDTSEIPLLDERFWRAAMRNPFLGPRGAKPAR